MSDAELREAALSSWLGLNANLSKFSPQDLERAIELELAGERRASYALRLLARACRLYTNQRFKEVRRRLPRPARGTVRSTE